VCELKSDKESSKQAPKHYGQERTEQS